MTAGSDRSTQRGLWAKQDHNKSQVLAEKEASTKRRKGAEKSGASGMDHRLDDITGETRHPLHPRLHLGIIIIIIIITVILGTTAMAVDVEAVVPPVHDILTLHPVLEM